MERTQINLRIDVEQLGRWQRQAASRGMNLSEWIRETCDVGAADSADVSGMGREHPVERGVAAPERTVRSGKVPVADTNMASRQPKRGKTCLHGIEVGWRCTLCGDVVR